MRRIDIKDKIFNKIVGHIESQTNMPLSLPALRGIYMAANDIVKTIQGSYRRRIR